jgi:peptidoglycan hydrolase-like protein with peptidoglycan-binding domain
MRPILCRSLLASFFALTLMSPGWAAQDSKAGENKPVEKQALSRDEVKKLQEALKAKGEDPGSMDGVMGRKTHAALKAFQKANGLKMTGTLNHETAEKLGVQLAATTGTQEMKAENKTDKK